MGTAIVITSGKGGTGKTTCCAAIASFLAGAGHRTVAIDCDIGLRNLDLALGLTDSALWDFSDLLEGRVSRAEGLTPHPDIENLWFLSAPTELTPPEVDPAAFASFIDGLRQEYDYILIDSPAGLGPGFQLATRGVDRAIVIATNDASSLRDAQRTVAELDHLKTVHLVMNRIQTKLLRKLRATIDDAMNAAGLPLIGVVPEDPQVMLCANLGRPLTTRGRRGAALACWNIAQRLEGRRVPVMRIR